MLNLEMGLMLFICLRKDYCGRLFQRSSIKPFNDEHILIKLPGLLLGHPAVRLFYHYLVSHSTLQHILRFVHLFYLKQTHNNE